MSLFAILLVLNSASVFGKPKAKAISCNEVLIAHSKETLKSGKGYFEVRGDLYLPHGQKSTKGGLNGQKLYYEYYPAEVVNGKPKSTFLLLPPLAGDIETWRPTIDVLRKQGFGVLGVDPLGHGKSLVKMMDEDNVLDNDDINAFTKAESIKSLIESANIENLQVVGYAHSGPEAYLIGADPSLKTKVKAIQLLAPYLERIDTKIGGMGRTAISVAHDLAGVWWTVAAGWIAPGAVAAAWATRNMKINAVSQFMAGANLKKMIRSYAEYEATRTDRHFSQKYLNMLVEKVGASIVNNLDITFIGSGRMNYDALTGETRPFDFVAPRLEVPVQLILGENDTLIPDGYYPPFIERLEKEKVSYRETEVPYKEPKIPFPMLWSPGHFASVLNPEGTAKALTEFHP